MNSKSFESDMLKISASIAKLEMQQAALLGTMRIERRFTHKLKDSEEKLLTQETKINGTRGYDDLCCQEEKLTISCCM